jgi:hypothetical protein
MASGHSKNRILLMPLKYFGVCNEYSPALPEKTSYFAKNVSRETFASGLNPFLSSQILPSLERFDE